MYSRILATGAALPERRVTNDDLARELAQKGIETNDEWIRTRTGIAERRFADPEKGETTTSLALKAARQALDRAGVSAESIDLLIVATTTPDMVFPSTAARVQAELGAAGCAAFDVQAVCAGFIYALNAADAMLRAGPYRRAVVVGSEVMSRVIDFDDRSTCVLFGDGLAARMYADGRQNEKVLGLTAHMDHGHLAGDPFVRMDGRQVYKLAVEGLVDSAREVAGLACVRTEDVALFVPHQANLRIMTMVAKKLGIPDERMVKTVAEHGNTSAASVPLALNAAVEAGMIQKGGLVLLQAVGAGMAWGSALVRW